MSTVLEVPNALAQILEASEAHNSIVNYSEELSKPHDPGEVFEHGFYDLYFEHEDEIALIEYHFDKFKEQAIEIKQELKNKINLLRNQIDEQHKEEICQAIKKLEIIYNKMINLKSFKQQIIRLKRVLNNFKAIRSKYIKNEQTEDFETYVSTKSSKKIEFVKRCDAKYNNMIVVSNKHINTLVKDYIEITNEDYERIIEIMKIMYERIPEQHNFVCTEAVADIHKVIEAYRSVLKEFKDYIDSRINCVRITLESHLEA